MFAVTVHFVIQDQKMASFLALVKENARLSLEREADCHRFDVLTDPDCPGEVFLYELYSDSAAFAQHLASDHFKSFALATGALVARKDVRTFRQVHA